MKPTVKYAIVVPYIDRAAQFDRTLASFAHHYGGRDDYIVVVVEDPKNTDDLQDVLSKYSGIVPLLHVSLAFSSPCWTPCPHYNQGVAAVDAEYVLPTNPECLHLTDVLAGMDDAFAHDPNTYVVCRCTAGSNVSMPDAFASLRYDKRQWCPRDLNFCTAISRVNYDRIGGFDEDYVFGLGFADDAFLDAIKGAGIPLVRPDGLVALHQDHPQVPRKGPKRAALVATNRRLYAVKNNQKPARYNL